jgi:Putative Ig domain/IPT/TIG domain
LGAQPLGGRGVCLAWEEVPVNGEAAPAVNAVNPASGTIGTQVTITGSGFAGVSGVSFGAAASQFSGGSASEITATVPAGAWTGPVAVTGPGGTASSPDPFTVTPGIALSAVSGSPGTTVTVAGAGFGAYEAVDIYFGTAGQALASASGTGNFAGITVQIPSFAPGPGTAYLTAVGRHSGLSAQAQFSVLNLVTVTNPGTVSTAIGKACSLPIQASDSASGQTLTYTATALPSPLSINPSTGLISGIPTTAGSFTVTVTAQDTTGVTGSATFIIDVVSVTVTNPGVQTSLIGVAVSLQIQASTSPPGRTLIHIESGLPPGLSISAAGLISGTPTTAGSFAVTVMAQDTTGASGAAGFFWHVGEPVN